MTDEIYYAVVDHYMNQCGLCTDLWLTFTLNLKWSALAMEEGLYL